MSNGFKHDPNRPMPKWRAPKSETAPPKRPTKTRPRDPHEFDERAPYKPTKYTLEEARAIIAEEQRVHPKAVATVRGRKDRRRGPNSAHRMCASGLPWKSWMSFPPPGWDRDE